MQFIVIWLIGKCLKLKTHVFFVKNAILGVFLFIKAYFGVLNEQLFIIILEFIKLHCKQPDFLIPL